jgi:hypothetical protein
MKMYILQIGCNGADLVSYIVQVMLQWALL